ncbi:hypothetical protein TELCIR_11306 [Teladorsagia circumcincta]|uniref:Uncharacterized protein n=1 Tax=Teladorsagia circumcincta TaxID=45464 RepID=A0A2G9U9T5_TELCI|nr:hypothetical protein TELCIR_11306 [Teladorsagia circumcincta]
MAFVFRYLHLLTEEHAAIKKERSLLEEFEGLEAAEREAFHQLSNRVRASHERERERAEKTKWWSVYVGSDMERLLDKTEKNLESKMKLQTLLSVVALYAAIGVAVPLLFATFRGG